MPTDHAPATLDYAEPPHAPSAGWRAVKCNLPVPALLYAVLLIGLFVVTRSTIGAYNLEVVMQVGVAIILAVSLQLINGFSGQFSLGHAGFMAVGAYASALLTTRLSSVPLQVAGPVMGVFAIALLVGGQGAVLVPIARLIWQFHVWVRVVFGVVLSILVFMLWDSEKALYRHLTSEPGQALLFFLATVAGGLCAAVAGLIVGLPTLRLRGDYLAIATLGFAEIIRVIIQNAAPLGGALGLGGIPNYTTFAWLYGAVIITIAAIWRIAYSAKGRAIQAVREDEIAAAAVGVDTTHHKVVAFVIGAFFAGVGGALYAHYTGFITPTDFGLIRSIEFVVMVTLGGLASVSGAVLAAVVLTLLPEVLRNVSPALVEWRMVFYALLLIVMMLLRPSGLLGGKELWPRRRRRGRGRAPRRLTSPTEDRPEPETAIL